MRSKLSIRMNRRVAGIAVASLGLLAALFWTRLKLTTDLTRTANAEHPATFAPPRTEDRGDLDPGAASEDADADYSDAARSGLPADPR